MLYHPLIIEHEGKIQKANDVIWKRVLIKDKKQIERQIKEHKTLIEIDNWKHIIEVTGSEENAVRYLENV